MVGRPERDLKPLARPEPAGLKAALRREAVGRRDALGEGARAALGRVIVRRVVSLAAYRRAGVVMAYASFGSELRTDGFLNHVLESGRTLVLPRVNREKGTLDLYQVRDPGRDLEAGAWSIPEPRVGTCAPTGIDAVDFALVPGAAFDGRGGRLGYGAGFYDRLLEGSAKRPYLVAGAFEVQMVQEIPLEKHDVLMDLVVTEGGVYPRAEERRG